MRLRGFLIIAVCFLLAGCARTGRDNIHGNAAIDWVDFVMLDDHLYNILYNVIPANPEDVTAKAIGKTEFKLAGMVTNPGYKTQNGDAAYLPVGTELYPIKGFEPAQLIAVRDPEKVGGYRLYAGEGPSQLPQQYYGGIPKDKVERIELYRSQDTRPLRTLQGAEKDQFIRLLEIGQDVERYTPQNKGKDPASYQMVFYTGGPLAFSFPLQDDGERVYFFPQTTRLLDPAVRDLLQP
ncbi:MAG: hypothetical protein K0Q90_2190 [Paenibacillaceae bacterium]|jgi:hypothetical protein|nr:hypothetical protein [Paenibacillaceae bacterium]